MPCSTIALSTAMVGFRSDDGAWVRTPTQLFQYAYAALEGVRETEYNAGPVVELIQKTVSNADPLLLTAVGKPYNDNACCNESGHVRPMAYFMKETPEIDVIFKRLKTITTIKRYVDTLSRGAYLYHLPSTVIQRPPLPIEMAPELTYAAIIKYCNFDNNLPIPREYYEVCQEKPQNYSPYWKLQEKMDYLRSIGKNYTREHFVQLMGLFRGLLDI
jgi:hypothetical protein